MVVKQGIRPTFRPIVKRKSNSKMLKKLALAMAITLMAAILYTMIADHTRAAKNQIKLQHTYQQLQLSKSTLQQEKASSAADTAAKQKQIEDLNKQLQDTQKQLQAKRDSAKVYAASLTPKPVAAIAGCGDNEYAHYIYMHESGCNPGAVNGIGCRGIGQACPGGKMPCGADYGCQNAYFTQYAAKYGGWAGAYSFWLAHSWW